MDSWSKRRAGVARAVEGVVKRRKHVVLVGLDGSGKTTVLTRLKYRCYVATTPTIGFNHEKVWGGGYRWSCWDVGGGERLRPLWSSYTRATDGLVYVVDSASPGDVMEEARVELARVLKKSRASSAQLGIPTPPLLVLANFQGTCAAEDRQQEGFVTCPTDPDLGNWRDLTSAWGGKRVRKVATASHRSTRQDWPPRRHCSPARYSCQAMPPSEMGEALLATAGDTIKLWDASNYTFYQEIPFENGHVNGLEWNQDGQCLASLGDSGDEILLSAICGKSAANIGVVRGIETPTCVKFACRSPHYLGVGSASGLVTIWNVKSQTKRKVFTPTDRAITRIAFSHSDSHIATATKKGTLYMLSIVNNLTAGPYPIFSNQVVTDLTYSRVKKSLVGCCSDGGSVSLFDTHASKVVHSFSSAHSSPVAAVSFSPVNELLMISVGYDKKLSCYNVQTRQPVMTHRSAAPLTSVTFLSMGQLVALGTMTGQVFIHDMRTIHSPLATLRAHRTAVTDVLLQPSPRSKSVSSSKTGQRNNTEATLTVPSQKPSKSCSDQPTELSPELKPKPESSPEDKFDLSVFSPIRDTNLPNQVQAPQASGCDQLAGLNINSPMDDAATHSVLSPIRTTNLQHNNQSLLSQWMVDVNEDNLLSPIRDTTLITKSDSDPTEVKPSSTVEVIVSPAMEVTDKENIEPSVSVTDDQSSSLQQTDAVPTIFSKPEEMESSPTQNSSQKADAQSPCVTFGKVSQKQHLTPKIDFEKCENIHSPHATQRPVPASDNTITGEETRVTKPCISSNSVDGNSPAPYFTMSPTTPSNRRLSPPKKRQLLRPVQAADLAPDTPPRESEASAATDAVAGTPATSHGAPQLQMELVRSCMVDVLEEFQDELNRRLMHMQYIMTKKFIQQQEVMEKLHRQYSLNEELMKENEQLRQQIAHLQAKY